MRRAKYFLLCITLVFPFFLVNCQEETPKEITCYQIVAAYEEAGYWVWHSSHDEGQDEYCRIQAKKEKEDDEYIYFRFFLAEEGAKKAKEQDEYHIVKWLLFAMFGEYRWCQSKRYGKIQYSYYDKSLVKPFNCLID